MRTYITLLVFVIFAAASYWLLDDISDETKKDEQEVKAFPNYFLEHFSLVNMSPQGLPEYTLRAKKMYHYSDDDRAELEHPFIDFTKNNNNISLNATRGIFLKKQNLIYLYDNVIIHRKASATQGELFIYTDYLKINTQTQIAETDSAIKIKTGDTEINSTGLIFNNLQGTLKLHSNVKGVYETPH